MVQLLALHLLQAGRTDVQDTAYVSTGVSQSEHAVALGHCGHQLFHFSPFRRTDIGKQSFSCAAPASWNSLPPAIINCDTLSVFKSRLKIHLIDTA